MKPNICINWLDLQEDLDSESQTSVGASADLRAKWRCWIASNVRNWLDKKVESYLQTAPREPVPMLGLSLSVRLSHRDFTLAPKQMISLLPIDLFHLQPDELHAYQMGSILYSWNPQSFTPHSTRISPFYDYMAAVHPYKDWSKITVEQAEEGHAKWVEDLNRKALESGGETEEVWTWTSVLTNPVIDAESGVHDTKTVNWTLHKLLDDVAYKAEGAVMNHCVASYFGKHDSAVYSLRQDGERVATIEVNTIIGRLVCGQIQGPKNAAVATSVRTVLGRWLTSAHIGHQELNPDDMPLRNSGRTWLQRRAAGGPSIDVSDRLGLAHQRYGGQDDYQYISEHGSLSACRSIAEGLTIGLKGPALLCLVQDVSIAANPGSNNVVLVIDGCIEREAIIALRRIVDDAQQYGLSDIAIVQQPLPLPQRLFYTDRRIDIISSVNIDPSDSYYQHRINISIVLPEEISRTLRYRQN